MEMDCHTPPLFVSLAKRFLFFHNKKDERLSIADSDCSLSRWLYLKNMARVFMDGQLHDNCSVHPCLDYVCEVVPILWTPCKACYDMHGGVQWRRSSTLAPHAYSAERMILAVLLWDPMRLSLSYSSIYLRPLATVLETV